MEATWPERYEEVFSIVWKGLEGRPPVWGDFLDEGREIGLELERGLLSNQQPSAPALRVLQALYEAHGEGVASLPLATTIHPRFEAVFENLPITSRLLDTIKAFVRHYWADNAPDKTEAQLDEIADAGAHVELNRHHGLFQWMHFGRRVYVLGEETAQLLARTDLPKFPLDDVPFPYPAFYLRVPRGMYELRGGHNRAPVDGILVTTDHSAANAGTSREICMRVCPDGPKTLGLPFPVAWGTFTAETTIGAAAERMHSEMVVTGVAEVDDSHDPLANLLFNFLLYLSSSHPELEPVPPPKKDRSSPASDDGHRSRARRKGNAETRLGYIRVGRDATRREPLRGRPHPQLARQVWVRGHWRNQAHGPEFSLRKHIWIEPHVRGPDLAEQMRRVHAGKVQDARRREVSEGVRHPSE